MSNANKVSWFELPADDVTRATLFYRTVFGWSTPSMGAGAAFALTVDADEQGNPIAAGGINGGFHQRQGSADAGPVINIMVDDVDAKLSEIVSAGGRVIQPQTDIEGYGISIGIFADTEGNVMGVYSPLAAS